jgi:hypothetical protein
MQRQIQWACVLGAIVLWQSHASGGINASAVLTPQQLGPNSYQYSLTLHNTGDTNIGTFWFAWIPNYDFLPSLPTVSSASQPAGWTGAVVQDGFLGGYSIEWTATTPLPKNQTLSGFTFTSPDSPTVINGIGNFAGFPVETSYVYIGASQTDPGHQFTTTTATPEPTLALLLPGLLLLRRKRLT